MPRTSLLLKDMQLKRDFKKFVLSRYSDLRENREYSTGMLTKFRDRLKKAPSSLLKPIECVAACGSYARYEASKSSDLDFLIVCKDGKSGSGIRDFIHGILDDLDLPKPNPKGVFANDGELKMILESAGATNETYGDLSKRLLLLLESTPLIQSANYEKIISSIIHQYAKEVNGDPRKNFVYLTNDLMRYFRTICVNYQHTMSEEWGKWPIRNIKLRHSRVLMYFSLIAVLGHLSGYHEKNKVEVLRWFIDMTPLERLFVVYHESNDTNFFRFAGAYDLFLRLMNEPHTRSALRDLEYNDRYTNKDFATLKANSDAIAAEITRFVFARQGQWSERFYEYLLI